MKAKTQLMNMGLDVGLLLVDVSRANRDHLVSNWFDKNQTFARP